jgi:hypothetical protein
LEDEQDELFALALRKVLELARDPVKPPAALIP